MTYIKNKPFITAVKFIYEHLDQPLTLERIAEQVGVSVSSLKRIFVEATGSSAGSFIRRLRMERAFRSLQNKEESVLEVALSSGFEDASAFSRTFKENFGYSPTSARNTINIVHELDCVTLKEPEIVDIEGFTIQAVTEKGLYFECAPMAWERLKSHLDDSMLQDDFTGTFIGMGHDNPHEGDIAENEVRFSAGVAHANRDLKCGEIRIPSGTYAKFNYSGKIHNMGLAYHYIYGTWLEHSSVKISSECPAFIVMNAFPDNMKACDVAIYVPLKMA